MIDPLTESDSLTPKSWLFIKERMKSAPYPWRVASRCIISSWQPPFSGWYRLYGGYWKSTCYVYQSIRRPSPLATKVFTVGLKQIGGVGNWNWLPLSKSNKQVWSDSHSFSYSSCSTQPCEWKDIYIGKRTGLPLPYCKDQVIGYLPEHYNMDTETTPIQFVYLPRWLYN